MPYCPPCTPASTSAVFGERTFTPDFHPCRVQQPYYISSTASGLECSSETSSPLQREDVVWPAQDVLVSSGSDDPYLLLPSFKPSVLAGQPPHQPPSTPESGPLDPLAEGDQQTMYLDIVEPSLVSPPTHEDNGILDQQHLTVEGILPKDSRMGVSKVVYSPASSYKIIRNESVRFDLRLDGWVETRSSEQWPVMIRYIESGNTLHHYMPVQRDSRKRDTPRELEWTRFRFTISVRQRTIETLPRSLSISLVLNNPISLHAPSTYRVRHAFVTDTPLHPRAHSVTEQDTGPTTKPTGTALGSTLAKPRVPVIPEERGVEMQRHSNALQVQYVGHGVTAKGEGRNEEREKTLLDRKSNDMESILATEVFDIG